MNKILTMTAKAALKAAVTAAGLASFGGSYQPAEPKGLQEMAKKTSTKFSK